MSRRSDDVPDDDDQLVGLLGDALDGDDPPPPGALDFAVGAFAWRGIDAELAELQHDSLADAALVRGGEDRLLVLQAGDLTVDLEHGAHRLLGSVSPPGRYDVELQVPDAGAPADARLTAATDGAGMFEIAARIRGVARIALRDEATGARVVSPWLVL